MPPVPPEEVDGSRCCPPKRLEVVPPVAPEDVDGCCCSLKRFDVVPPVVPEVEVVCCCPPPKRFDVWPPVCAPELPLGTLNKLPPVVDCCVVGGVKLCAVDAPSIAVADPLCC